MSYVEQLSDPKWLAKRLKILRRDHFKCTACGSTENLRVHHTFYYPVKTEPWKYPNKSLITLCDKCHHDYHATHENTIRTKHKKKPKIKNAKKPVIRKEYVIETLSFSGKTIIRKTCYGTSAAQVRKSMSKKGRPVIGVKLRKAG